MKRKITKLSHYVNILYLPPLRNASIQYQKALRYFEQEEWAIALKEYEKYIKDYNTIDWDSYFEAGICRFHVAKCKQEEDKGYLVDYKKSLWYLQKTVSKKPRNKRYANALSEVKQWVKSID